MRARLGLRVRARAWLGRRLGERAWLGRRLGARGRLGLGVGTLWTGGMTGECGGWLLGRLGGWLLRGLFRLSMTRLSCWRLLPGPVGCSWLSRVRSSGGFMAS